MAVCIILGIVFASAAIVFVIRMRQVDERPRALEQLHIRFGLATRAAHIGVFDHSTLDGDASWNDVMYQIFGEDPAVFKPTVQGWLARIYPGDRQQVLENAGSTLGTATSPGIQYRIVRPDGTIRHLQAIGPLAEKDRRDPGRIFGMVMDITERVEAEERERSLQRKLRESVERAGVAQIATGVVDRVGDVLNNLGIASTAARRELQAPHLDRLQEASSMISSNRAKLATYLLQSVMTRHRNKWADLFLRTSMWMHESRAQEDSCWRELALIAKAVASGRDLSEIGLMRDIAERTVVAHANST